MLGRWCCVWPPPWPRLPVGAKPYNFSPWSPERPPPLPESRRLLIEESCRFRASRTCVCLGTISRGEAMFLIAVILLRTLKSSKSHSYSCRTLDLYPRISLSTHYRRIRVDLTLVLKPTETVPIVMQDWRPIQPMSQLIGNTPLQFSHQQAQVSSHGTKPFRVIVADDDNKDRHRLQYVLTKWGFEVCLASDGFEAWELLQSADVPTIAILDWVMPKLTGIELCQKIRSAPGRHYTYIVVVTGMGDQQHMVAGLRAGADDYLAKPFDADELQGRLLLADRILSVQEQLSAAHAHAKFKANQVVT